MSDDDYMQDQKVGDNISNHRKIDQQTFSSLLKKYPMIWDSSNQDSKNKQLKAWAWEELTTRMLYYKEDELRKEYTRRRGLAKKAFNKNGRTGQHSSINVMWRFLEKDFILKQKEEEIPVAQQTTTSERRFLSSDEETVINENAILRNKYLYRNHNGSVSQKETVSTLNSSDSCRKIFSGNLSSPSNSNSCETIRNYLSHEPGKTTKESMPDRVPHKTKTAFENKDDNKVSSKNNKFNKVAATSYGEGFSESLKRRKIDVEDNINFTRPSPRRMSYEDDIIDISDDDQNEYEERKDEHLRKVNTFEIYGSGNSTLSIKREEIKEEELEWGSQRHEDENEFSRTSDKPGNSFNEDNENHPEKTDYQLETREDPMLTIKNEKGNSPQPLNDMLNGLKRRLEIPESGEHHRQPTTDSSVKDEENPQPCQSPILTSTSTPTSVGHLNKSTPLSSSIYGQTSVPSLRPGLTSTQTQTAVEHNLQSTSNLPLTDAQSSKPHLSLNLTSVPLEQTLSSLINSRQIRGNVSNSFEPRFYFNPPYKHRLRMSS